MEAIHGIIIYFQIFQTPFEVKNLFETGSREMRYTLCTNGNGPSFAKIRGKREKRGDNAFRDAVAFVKKNRRICFKLGRKKNTKRLCLVAYPLPTKM